VNDLGTHAGDWKIHPRRPLPPLLNEVKELAVAELHRRLGEEGHPTIRPGHGCVFRFIDREGSRLTDLAEHAGLTKQAVGEVVADLEELGYVERVPDPGDGRVKIIRLTERGWDGQAAALRIFDDIERGWAERFGEERVRVMHELLEEIAAAERAPEPARA
jgi:DNA-binding MarR family transcriptional regulator